ncbi:hypothetical protein WMY93_014023 [Mugilogobius chulae]|uniref:Uncharacterized protein n=1 Tax=Mugilogobius chulae TaxID=88201 RepID=A0AAW0NU55_9GOBI
MELKQELKAKSEAVLELTKQLEASKNYNGNSESEQEAKKKIEKQTIYDELRQTKLEEEKLTSSLQNVEKEIEEASQLAESLHEKVQLKTLHNKMLSDSLDETLKELEETKKKLRERSVEAAKGDERRQTFLEEQLSQFFSEKHEDKGLAKAIFKSKSDVQMEPEPQTVLVYAGREEKQPNPTTQKDTARKNEGEKNAPKPSASKPAKATIADQEKPGLAKKPEPKISNVQQNPTTQNNNARKNEELKNAPMPSTSKAAKATIVDQEKPGLAKSRNLRLVTYNKIR